MKGRITKELVPITGRTINMVNLGKIDIKEITKNHWRPDWPCPFCGGSLERTAIRVETNLRKITGVFVRNQEIQDKPKGYQKIMIDGIICTECKELGMHCGMWRSTCNCEGKDTTNFSSNNTGTEPNLDLSKFSASYI